MCTRCTLAIDASCKCCCWMVDTHRSDSYMYMCDGCGEQKDQQFNFCLCDAAEGGVPVVLGPTACAQIKSVINRSTMPIENRRTGQYNVIRDASRSNHDQVDKLENTIPQLSATASRSESVQPIVCIVQGSLGLTTMHDVASPPTKRRSTFRPRVLSKVVPKGQPSVAFAPVDGAFKFKGEENDSC